MTTFTTDTRHDAENLRTWLLLPGAAKRYPGADLMAAYLNILLTSITPDTEQLLADEIEAVKRIICGAAQP